MTDAASPPREVVIYQNCLLDLYDSILEACAWDEAKVNAMLKTFMASLLALVRVQQSLGQEVATSQKEWVRQYRAQLEQWLEEQSAPAAESR
jgi:hypothetical protein